MCELLAPWVTPWEGVSLTLAQGTVTGREGPAEPGHGVGGLGSLGLDSHNRPAASLGRPLTLGRPLSQAAGHNLTDAGRHRRGGGPPASPAHSQRAVFSAGRGAQDGVLQPLKDTHERPLGLAGPGTAARHPRESTGVRGAPHRPGEDRARLRSPEASCERGGCPAILELLRAQVRKGERSQSSSPGPVRLCGAALTSALGLSGDAGRQSPRLWRPWSRRSPGFHSGAWQGGA